MDGVVLDEVGSSWIVFDVYFGTRGCVSSCGMSRHFGADLECSKNLDKEIPRGH